MKAYKVDLDYESFLFDPNYIEDSSASLKIIREFEYVFFLVNQEDCALKALKTYEKKYLTHLKTLGFFIPEFNRNALSIHYWWGLRKNIEIEKLLNSKITSANLARENSWGFHEGALVSDMSALKNHIAKYPNRKKWIIKRPFSFSGIGHYQFNTDNLNEFIVSKILIEVVLLEPVFERVFDIGTTFVIADGIIQRQFMVENFNSPEGGFKGGAGSSDVDKFKKYIHNRYSYSLRELEENTREIADLYIKKGATSNIQIDSFVYRDNEELKLYSLVEVNYRKTMGLVIDALARKYSDANWIEWRIAMKNEPQPEVDFILSPDDSRFTSGIKIF
jgi:hypothetical protein